MLIGKKNLFNMLYFLCKSARNTIISGKNMFDFIEKCIYNGSYRHIFTLFLEEKRLGEQI